MTGAWEPNRSMVDADDRPATVLLADGEERVREVLARTLGGDDRYEVVGEVGDLASAVLLAEGLRPEAVIVGGRLSDSTGARAAQRLRQAAPDAVLVLVDEHPGSTTAPPLPEVDARYARASGPAPVRHGLRPLVDQRRAGAGGGADALPPVLLLEDDPVVAAVTTDLLAATGMRNPIVHHPDTGPAVDWLATHLAPHQRPALALLDMVLPSGLGLDVLRWIRGRAELDEVPVIMLTGRAELEEINEAYRLGLTSYLVKPVGFDALAATVRGLEAPWALLPRAERP